MPIRGPRALRYPTDGVAFGAWDAAVAGLAASKPGRVVRAEYGHRRMLILPSDPGGKPLYNSEASVLGLTSAGLRENDIRGEVSAVVRLGGKVGRFWSYPMLRKLVAYRDAVERVVAKHKFVNVPLGDAPSDEFVLARAADGSEILARVVALVNGVLEIPTPVQGTYWKGER